MNTRTADLRQAVGDLEVIGRKVFDNFEPLWDEDERRFREALALLQAYLREISQP